MSLSHKTSAASLAYKSLFIALLAISAQISIPLPVTAIPITLQTFILLIMGGLLSPKSAASVTGVYLLLGIIGIPVFSHFSGGIQMLVGPTGGFLVAFIPSIVIFSYLIQKPFAMSKMGWAVSLFVFHIILFFIGSVWFSIVMKTPFITSITLCVIPFLPGDILKCIGVFLIYPKISRVLKPNFDRLS